MRQDLFRYQGLRPYQTRDRDRFYGRAEDTRALYNLLMRERLVVLFGKSGYGKSSLLNAGIVPLLVDPGLRHPGTPPAPAPQGGHRHDPEGGPDPDEARRYRPLPVRLGSAHGTGGASPLEILRRFLDIESPEAAAPPHAAQSLWQHFKRRQTDAQPVRYVLLFDQFEEFFSYPPDQQRAFNEALAELLYETLPQDVRQAAAALPREDRSRLARPMDVRVVMAIRADRMSELDSMTWALPAILSTRYELRALDRTQATDAMVRPALQQPAPHAQPFASPPFAYTLQALMRLLETLDPQGKGVEAFLLQVLCGFVERQAMDGRVLGRDAHGMLIVSLQDLPEHFGQVLAQYYHTQLAAMPPGQQHTAAALVEEGLLNIKSQTEADRISVDEATLLARPGVSPALLRALEDSFLVRAETNSLGRRTLELSHDTLVEPVLQAYWGRQTEAERQRLAAEAEAARQKAAAEALRLQEMERLKNQALAASRRATFRARTAAAVALLAFIAAIWALIAQNRAERATAQAQNATAQAQNAIHKNIESDMVRIPGGTFWMGSSPGDANAYDREKPRHQVQLDTFYMAAAEVTQLQFTLIMGRNPSDFAQDGSCLDCPVEDVTWYDCIEFCNRLSELTGKRPCYRMEGIERDAGNSITGATVERIADGNGYRLPTEAEWEYAARGGSGQQPYAYAGSNDLNAVAWHGQNSGSKTHPVKTKQPNALGLYDMSGNVYEWCQDWYGSDYYASSPSSNPSGPATGSTRVLRGGSWPYDPQCCRSAYRNNSAPAFRFNYIGFRLCLSVQ